MLKHVFFTAKKDVTSEDGGPVTIAGVRCRFIAGKHYAIAERGNEKLIAALRVGVEGGDFAEMDEDAGARAVRDQDAKRLKEKALHKRQRLGDIAAPKAKVTASVESAGGAK